MTEKSLSNGSPRLGASLPENGIGVSFRSRASLKNYTMDLVPEKEDLCQLTSVMLCCLFWTSSSEKMGPIGYPKMSIRIYHSTLHIISEEHRFDDAGHGLAPHGPVRCFICKFMTISHV